jgi:hypothetical protein
VIIRAIKVEAAAGLIAFKRHLRKTRKQNEICLGTRGRKTANHLIIVRQPVSDRIIPAVQIGFFQWILKSEQARCKALPPFLIVARPIPVLVVSYRSEIDRGKDCREPSL